MKLTAYCTGAVFGRYRCITKILLYMRLTMLLFLSAVFYANGEGFSQTVTYSARNVPLIKVLEAIKKQTGYRFFYDELALEGIRPVTIQANARPLNEFLKELFHGAPLDYTIENKTIVITRKRNTGPVPGLRVQSAAEDAFDPPAEVWGRVVDVKSGEPIAGASIRTKKTTTGTTSDGKGDFYLKVYAGDTLVVSFIGYESRELRITRSIRLTIEMAVSDASMKDVVVTGLFTRKAETFTGSTATFSQKELLEVGNRNIIKSLSNLDPSFRVIDNLQFGSDPNRLPDIQLRGQTGLPDLNNEYATNPNLPLFILDGFEATMQRIIDLDMYLVKSVTILKDAASKSIYGSRAANGVVVIETIRPAAGKLQVTYNFNLNTEIPDLSSYDLTNAREKMEVEMAADRIWNARPVNANDIQSRIRYFTPIMQNVERGVNTYWLSQPLRNGVGQRHSLSLGGGDNAWRYNVELGYNNIKGVMIGSQRSVYSGGITLTYRYKNVSIGNTLRLSSTRADNSPYGDFTEFAKMNPYIELYDSTGKYARNTPLWNGTVGVRDFSKTNNLINNLDINYTIIPSLRFNARIGYNLIQGENDVFLPAEHNSFPAIGNGSQADLERGSYTKRDNQQLHVNATTTLSYSKTIGSNTLFANIGADMNENKRNDYSFRVVGFPNPRLDYPSAALQYAPQSRLGGGENITRDAGLFTAVNYAFDQRFLFDASYRLTRSSQFGVNEPWGKFWSLGAGWNLHNESLIQDMGIFNQLRVTATTGFSGSQPLNSYVGLPTYKYIEDNVYFGQYSALLMGLANPNLRAQRRQDNNFSVNMTLLDNKLNLVADYYQSYTDGLITDVNLPYSNGFETYKENLGKVENRGIDIRLNYQVFSNTAKGSFLSLFVTAGSNKNRLTQISNSIIALTSKQDATLATSPKQRFEVGQSMTAIWAVPSLGIDPVSGKEVYVRKDGTYTFVWDATDQIAAGDQQPDLMGNFGFNVRYKGWQLNTSFAYKFGGQQYNQTLVDKVENANLAFNADRRIFTSRWRQPGDISLYKNIQDASQTYPTTRFVEDWNEVAISIINLSYDLDQIKKIKQIGFKRLRASLVLDNGFVFSSIKMERGLIYPFARTFSFTLQTLF